MTKRIPKRKPDELARIFRDLWHGLSENQVRGAAASLLDTLGAATFRCVPWAPSDSNYLCFRED